MPIFDPGGQLNAQPVQRVVSSRGSSASDDLTCVSTSISANLATITQQAERLYLLSRNQGQHSCPHRGTGITCRRRSRLTTSRKRSPLLTFNDVSSAHASSQSGPGRKHNERNHR